jgi:hypothetical protein
MEGAKLSGRAQVALVAYGVGITEILPMAMCELQQPEPESVRVLWASRTKVCPTSMFLKGLV